MVKDYDCDIRYHLEKANIVADALSRKMTSAPIRDLCLRMIITSPLLDLIKDVKFMGLKEGKWKKQKTMVQIPSFVVDSQGLLT